MFFQAKNPYNPYNLKKNPYNLYNPYNFRAKKKKSVKSVHFGHPAFYFENDAISILPFLQKFNKISIKLKTQKETGVNNYLVDDISSKLATKSGVDINFSENCGTGRRFSFLI